MPGHRDIRDRGHRWKRLRLAVLARDGHRCQLTYAGTCTTVATCVHHTLGVGVTGDNPAFLVASCQACNLKAGEPDGGDARPRRTTRW